MRRMRARRAGGTVGVGHRSRWAGMAPIFRVAQQPAFRRLLVLDRVMSRDTCVFPLNNLVITEGARRWT